MIIALVFTVLSFLLFCKVDFSEEARLLTAGLCWLQPGIFNHAWFWFSFEEVVTSRSQGLHSIPLQSLAALLGFGFDWL